jgi:hypothetical protein
MQEAQHVVKRVAVYAIGVLEKVSGSGFSGTVRRD